MKKILTHGLYLLIALPLLFASCKSSKDYVMLKDLEVGNYDVQPRREAIIQPGDRLNIYVTNDIQELAAPFNSRSGFTMSDRGETQQGGTPNELQRGFLVDQEGLIEYPVFGKIKVSGLTLTDISSMIKERIVTSGIMKSPIVTTEILNFKVYSLGIRGGAYTAVDGQLTLLEVLAQMQDISSNARIDNVKVIREIDGQRFVYTVDLQSKDLYDSPVYYLQQNDMIYLEPRYRMRDEVNIALRYMSVVTAVSSLATTLIYLFKK